MKITKIKIDYKLNNLNDIIDNCRRNKYGANYSKKKEMEVCRVFLRNVPKIEKYPIIINCEWHVKNLGSDLDNKLLKSVLDAMQEMGILESDNIRHINEINHRAIKDKEDYLIMEIIEGI